MKQQKRQLFWLSAAYVLTSIGVSVASAVQPFALKTIFDNYTSLSRMRDGLILYGITVVLILLFEYLSKLARVRTSLNITAGLRTQICDTIEYREQLDTSQDKLAEINVDLNRNIEDYIETYFLNRLDILLLAVSLIVYGYSILQLDVVMIFIILIPNLLAVALPYLYRPKVSAAREAAIASTERFNRKLLDFFAGIRVLKNMFAEKAWRRRVDRTSDDNLAAQKDAGYLDSFVEVLIALISYAGTLILLIYGVYGIARDSLTIGTLVASFYFAELITLPIIRLISAVNTLTSGKVLRQRLRTRYATPVPVTAASGPAPDLGAFRDLEVADFSFAYGDNLDIGFDAWRIGRGDKVLVTGANGSGKSTLMKVITGLEKDYGGHVRLNGHELSSLPADTLNKYYAILEQSNHIFHTDVPQNLSLYTDLDPADHGEVLSLVRYAEIPQTDPTSQSLSGGEKQRLGLARALMRDKDVLIIDEQLNQIQKDNREEILEKLLAAPELTLFYISHNTDAIHEKFNVVIELDGHRSSFTRRA